MRTNLIRHEREEDAYTVESLDVSDLTEAERTRCLQLIWERGAVTMATARRDFPRSKTIAVARKDGEVVGVASIKPIREDYAAGRAAKAKHRFGPKTPELGYVVVDPPHRGHRLSSRMAQALTRKWRRAVCDDFQYEDAGGPDGRQVRAAGYRVEGTPRRHDLSLDQDR